MKEEKTKKSPASEPVLKEYNFSELGVTIKAENYTEALKKLNASKESDKTEDEK